MVQCAPSASRPPTPAVAAATESGSSNFLAYRTEDEVDEALATLDKLLRSDEVRAFIEERWPLGEVLPAF